MKLSILATVAAVAASASAQNCNANKITALENHISNPVRFCQFWLRGGIKRVYPVLPAQSAAETTTDCECILEEAGVALHPIKKWPVASAGICNEDLAVQVAAEFNATRFFCEYFKDQVRKFSPSATLSPQDIYDGCACYIGDSYSSSPVAPSATTSAGNSSTAATSATTTSSDMTTATSSDMTTATSASTTASSTGAFSNSTIPVSTYSSTTLMTSASSTNGTTATTASSTESSTASSTVSAMPTTTGTSNSTNSTDSDAMMVRRRVEAAMAAYLEEVNGAEI